ncbi:MAG: cell division protein ZapA [Alphaproteobacteria bacterium]|nr:cell division protein ZapA [Alphaproteobacteria bacterium]
MPLVNVMVNGKAYTLGCGEGEEPHLKELAALVDVKVREAQTMVGAQASDTKLLLTAALLLADEHHDTLTKLGSTSAAAGSLEDERAALTLRAQAAEQAAADALDAAAASIEKLALLAGAGAHA